ncbi:MAG: serine/threonine protein kinase [Proteobacteria bacterium]|nr:serine/threonine protein kinase [Pseudomonadota bacterium]
MTATSPQSTRKFHFIREIAAGGFGSVYLAKIIHADGFSRLAAIKLLHPKWSEHEEIVKRMRDEARLLGWLRHRNIVDVLDLTMIDGRCAVIMEYLEAVDLKLVVKSASLQEERLPMRVCLEIAASVASALDAAYNRPPYAGEKPLRVIHRDIKPSNVMIDDSGTPKVLDFGVARADFDTRESHTQELSFGSLDYMPPERLFFEPESASSDIYSLGATLYELLVLERMGKGKLSRDAQDEHVATQLQKLDSAYASVDPAVREELADLLFEMLSFEPTERPSAAATVDRLRSLARKRKGDPALSEWAESHVPPLVQAFHAPRPSGAPDPLLDATLGEDSRPFGRYATEEMIEDPELRDEAPEPTDHSEALDDAVRLTGPEDDERWQKLKEHTLAEISEEVSHQRAVQTFEIENPATGGGLGAALTFEVDADDSPTMAFGDMAAFTEWEEDEKPTIAMTADEFRMASLLENQVPEEWGEAADDLEEAPTVRDVKRKAPGSAPPALPPSLRGRSADVHTAPFARPTKNPPTAPSPVRSAPTAVPADPPPAAPVVQQSPAQHTPVIQEVARQASPAPAGRSALAMLGSLVFASGIVLVFGLIGLALGVVGIRSMKADAPASAEVVPAKASAAPAEAPVIDDSPLAADEALFNSGLDAPKKLVVSCGGDKVTGVSAVRLTVVEGADCMVTAISADRSRKTARVPALAGTWTCFEAGGEDCLNPDAPIEPAEGEEGEAEEP